MNWRERIMRWLLGLALVAVALPGNGADLKLCIGDDGHWAVSAVAGHGCRNEATPESCSRVTSDNHGSCVDAVLCSGDPDWVRRSSLQPRTLGLQALPPATMPRLPTTAGLAATWPAMPMPRSDLLDPLRSVVRRQ